MTLEVNAVVCEDGSNEEALAVVTNTFGERRLVEAKKPAVAGPLPNCFRDAEFVRFDPQLYDLRAEATILLERAGPLIGFGSFEGGAGELESFHALDAVFNSFKYEKRWRQCVREATGLLQVYERLVCDVVCPHLRSKLEETSPVTFHYQYPPTLRLQPGPSTQYRRAHRDAEYGHQEGELNFWMPLTFFGKTQTTLWVESRPDAGDFYPLEIDYGTVAMFHGSLCRHSVPANASEFIRVSMDFRIGVGDFFDPAWSLEGLHHVHGRRRCTL